ncbi:ATP-binding protein [Jannaschia sp. Os4]|uniref:ATP-binding protein n=1 Tax=Jannaschia sp. Os4 TaxID=2807617 RepID=UPI00193A5A7D|nr:ATP-binding protein [Jannaschia sp. Os4]MBM2575370.1 ATP-binding protein [Jannaschia sp. Os4]
MTPQSLTQTVSTSAFATRARTVDHLGREQIADCPTAISELWKNSWDAYSRNVGLRLYAEEPPVAVLTDDGHGMRASDLVERWLVIGTESKLSDAAPPSEDMRNGLEPRPRQGQKGIGRLSSAKLGSILLLVTKHRDDSFVAALIDWRMFENPFINLSDVAVATGRFENCSAVFDGLDDLVNALVGGIAAEPDKWRASEPRLLPGWERYDAAWHAQDPSRSGLPPSKRILQSMKRLPFREEHLADWQGPGTVMLVYDLDDTLKALPATGDTNLVKAEIAERFEQTLSNFVDPYAVGRKRPDFAYRAEVVFPDDGAGPRTSVVVGAERAIDRTQVHDMEHQIDGRVGADGVFRGRLKAFGTWLDQPVEFELPKGLTMPDRANTRVGAFDLYIASMEFTPDNSTHSRAEHQRYSALAEDYSGLMIYRDGLRVLPYGREDNDFFSIEYKRSKNAGRYFWNHRQMFGRIAVSRRDNPNLKDKAGREGFIDNTAAKTFRAVVGNILDLSARRYFGSASDIRKPRLKEIQEQNRAGRAEEEAKKLRARERKQFEKELVTAEQTLPELLDRIETATRGIVIERDADVASGAARSSEWWSELAEASVRPQPSGTAKFKPRYQAAMAVNEAVSEAIADYETRFRDELGRFAATEPERIVADRIAAARSAVERQIEDFKETIAGLQREQFDMVRKLAEQRIADFRREARAVGDELGTRRTELTEIIDSLAGLQTEWTAENRNIFGIYVSALETVRERIDLETLASIQVQDLREKAAELDRLTALAQLGIAVEIAAHDLVDFDAMATSGLDALPPEVRDGEAARNIRLGLEGLTDQLRFLSPLRLSGDKTPRTLTGAEIAEFSERFFAPTFARARIGFEATEAFRSMRLYERPARVFPVFLNLINNSVYWVGTVPPMARRILLDAVDGEVVIADSGPGVATEDVEQIFNLFFTRKQRSGRGVGLYLAKANLAAGGHALRYREPDEKAPLAGAAFYIRFRDAEFGDSEE